MLFAPRTTVYKTTHYSMHPIGTVGTFCTHVLLFTPACSLQAIDRRERLRRLALETIDLAKDPYFMRNHLG